MLRHLNHPLEGTEAWSCKLPSGGAPSRSCKYRFGHPPPGLAKPLGGCSRACHRSRRIYYWTTNGLPVVGPWVPIRRCVSYRGSAKRFGRPGQEPHAALALECPTLLRAREDFVSEGFQGDVPMGSHAPSEEDHPEPAGTQTSHEPIPVAQGDAWPNGQPYSVFKA